MHINLSKFLKSSAVARNSLSLSLSLNFNYSKEQYPKKKKNKKITIIIIERERALTTSSETSQSVFVPHLYQGETRTKGQQYYRLGAHVRIQ